MYCFSILNKLFFGLLILCVISRIHAQSIYQTDFESSEGYTQNALDGQLGWTAGNFVTVDDLDPYSGTQLIWLPFTGSGVENQIARTFNSSSNDKVVYVDFYLSPNAATSFQALPDISGLSSIALSGLVNKGNGLGEWAVVHGDGSGGGVWKSTSKFIPLNGSTASNYLWYVYKLNYEYKDYDFFVNGVLIAEKVPFINSSMTRLNRFKISADGKQDVYFDLFTVSYDMPIDLDDDKDGLLTTTEDSNGNDAVDPGETNFMVSDTDGDGMGDAIEPLHGFDPLTFDTFGIPLKNNSGTLIWKTGFETVEGFTPGNLNNQLLWEATEQVELTNATASEGTSSIKLTANELPVERFARHYFGTDGIDQVWISFYGKLSEGVLPATKKLNTSAAGIFKLDESGNLAVFDGYQDQWIIEEDLFDDGYFNDGDWKHYVVHLDYPNRRWTLIAEGGIVFRNIPFDRETPGEFSYFKARQLNTVPVKESAFIDQLIVTDTEPEGLDFDFDKIINQDERNFSESMGLDLYNPDSDGNEVKDGFDDFDGDGNNNAYEFAKGRLPDFRDADVDLYVDVVLGDDNSYNGLSAMPGRPTLTDGPKSSIAATFAAADDSAIILLQAGTYDENTLTPNGKTLTLRANGPVTIR